MKRVVSRHALVLGLIGLGVVLLLLGGLVGHGLQANWDAAQWGPLSAWVSGLLTAFAVTVALLQTVGNRRDAEANRRAEQARTIPPIWKAVADLDVAYEKFKLAMEKGRQAIAGSSHPSHQERGRRQLDTDYQHWRDHVREVDSAFEPALVTITEPKTQQAITNSYALFSQLANHCHTALKNIEYGQPEKFQQTDKYIRRLRQSRREVTQIARLHLIMAPPWRVEPAYLEFGDGPEAPKDLGATAATTDRNGSRD